MNAFDVAKNVFTLFSTIAPCCSASIVLYYFYDKMRTKIDANVFSISKEIGHEQHGIQLINNSDRNELVYNIVVFADGNCYELYKPVTPFILEHKDAFRKKFNERHFDTPNGIISLTTVFYNSKKIRIGIITDRGFYKVKPEFGTQARHKYLKKYKVLQPK